MKIISKLVMRWDDTVGRFVTLEEVSQEYGGPIALCCGATPGQKDIAAQQTSFSQQLVSQATQVFGSSNSTFKDLVSSFYPTLSAGPNQKGFSPAEESILKSQAITQTGQAYKNAKAAVGNAQAGENGGNVNLPTGAKIGTDLGLAESGANQTADELGKIDQKNYEVGRQNYDFAAQGMEASTGVFNPATSAGDAATSSQKAAADTQNQIAQSDNSWVNAVTGALGNIAGTVLTGGMNNLGKGLSFLGGKTPTGGSGSTGSSSSAPTTPHQG